MRKSEGELSQRVLALELRYAIDVARVKPTANAFGRVKALIEANPHGAASRHVEYNLGVARMEWMRRNKLL